MIFKDQINILVVEDDFLISEEIIRTINKAGFNHIGTASDGNKAIDMIQELQPDVILMDIKMPGMNGLEVANLTQNFFPTPVVILTAHESEDLILKASECGVGAYLTKPPQAEEIKRAVFIAIARHGDMMELRKLNKEINIKNEKLQNALDEVKTLRGIIPICSFCKKIRDDEGAWNRLEAYISQHTDAQFSHGICPDCLQEEYPDIADDINSDPIKKKTNIH